MAWSVRHTNHPKKAAGYLLPVVIALGLAVSIMGVTALQTVVWNSQSLNSQAYKAIANQAAKAGIIAAQRCMSDPATSTTTTWPLVSIDCTSSTASIVIKSSDSNGDYESTFSVAAPQPTTLGNSTGSLLTARGIVKVRGGLTIEDTARAFAKIGDDRRASRNVQQVSVGPNTVCVVATDANSTNGWPYCWGDNTSGQLGIGYYLGGDYNSSGFSTLPTAVANSHVDARPATDQSHFVCNGWQTSWFGCLSFGSYTVTDVYVPSSPAADSGLQNKVVTKVSVGTDHTCAIARDTEYDAKSAKAYCWGANAYGQLGNRAQATLLVPTAVDTQAAWSVTTPGYCNGTSNPFTGCAFPTGVWVPPVTTNYPGSALNGKTVVDISAGNHFTCVRYVDPSAVTNGSSGTTAAAAGNLGSKVACWGANNVGQVGDNSRTDRNIPTDVDTSLTSAINNKQIKSLATVKGGATMCVTDTADNPYCWGQNYSGQVGNGLHGSYDQITGWACGWQFGDHYPDITTAFDSLKPSAVLGGFKFRDISIYDSWTTAVSTGNSVTNPNRAYYWGGTTGTGCGVLNAAARFYYATSIPTLTSSTETAGSAPFKNQQLGSYVSGNPYKGPLCATLIGDQLYCAGITPAPSDLSTPLNETARLSGRTITDLDVSPSGYSCIVTRTTSIDGQVDCWGKNNLGQLGNRMLASRSTPFPVDTYRPVDTSIPASALGTPGSTITNLIYF